MKCPHCLVEIHVNPEQRTVGKDKEGTWLTGFSICPACKEAIIELVAIPHAGTQANFVQLVYPRSISRAPLPEEVLDKYANDYKEACAVLNDSPKASAALSRRCLQLLLRDEAKVKHSDLSKEIDEILDRKTLPTHLADAIDAIRKIGNFATHPIKSTSSGDIVDVEPGEAEWQLDVLEGLFGFYFVQPALLKKKKDALNKKLKDAGKPPMK